jgi:Flp pilus assembly protein TadG
MRRTIVRFLRNRDGNFAMITGLAALPLLLGVGMALDVSHVARKHSQLQQAADAAVLAVAREGDKLSADRAHQIAEQFLASNYNSAVSDLRISRDGTRVSLDVNAGTALAFGGLLGKDSWPLAVSASADVAYVDYEIGLVLDTTGSMKGGKLQAMKDAVVGLIDTMSAQVDEPERLKFAIVPFATFVNVGPQYGPKFDSAGKQIAGTGASWLDLEGKADFKQSELAPGASRFQLYENLGQKWRGCVETRDPAGKDLDVSDAAADPNNAQTLFVPAFGIDEPDTYANSYIASNAVPNDPSIAAKRERFKKYGVKTDSAGKPELGGLLDPAWSLLAVVIDPLTGKKKIPIDTSGGKGPGRACDMAPITPLSNKYDDLKKKVNALQANGNTNITEGVAWGWRVLSPGEPFTEGKDRSTGVQKIMIVLTDGANVFGTNGTGLGSSYSSYGYLVDGRLGISAGGQSATNTLMNSRTLAACDKVKAEGIEVYTIRLEEPDVKTGTVLKQCASVPDHYFDVPTRTMLDEAFGKIRDKIVKLRISS